MIIVFIPFIYFYAIIFAVAALGLQLAVFLQQWIIPISITIWAISVLIALFIGRKAEDPVVKILLFSLPFSLIPFFYVVIQSLYDCVVRTAGFEMLLMVFIEFPMIFCFVLLLCIGVLWVATWFKRHVWLGLLVSFIGNAAIMHYFYGFWGPIG